MLSSKSLDQWLYEYGESHQNQLNQKIHTVCVPVIFWTVVAFLYLFNVGGFPLGKIISGLALVFYFRLNWSTGFIMSFVVVLSYVVCHLIQKSTGQLFGISMSLFIVAWIGQFIGHKIEGKKPSFFDDLKYLLIGPIWVFKH